MTKLLVWIGLASATAATDYLSARWVDASSARARAALSAVHEAVGLVAGFTIFALYRDWSMIVPCVLGAAIGSYWAGVASTPDAVDSDLVVACPLCGEAYIQLTTSQTCCYTCRARGAK
jgi:hypothetical protein